MDYLQLISSVGFPIVMCLWFMFKTEKVMSENSKALNNLSDKIELLCIQKK